MRTKGIVLSLVFAWGATLGLATLLHSPDPGAPRAAPPQALHTAPGATFCVSPSGGTPPGCDQGFTRIQAAVDAASGGELIKVAAGVYDDVHARDTVSQVVYIDRSVTIRGGYTTTDAFADPPDPAAHPTAVDGQGIGRGVTITGPVTVTLEGLRLTNGWSDDKGGGLFAAHARVTISRCQIFSNSVANEGAGLFLRHADQSALVQSDVFSNTAEANAGGIFLESSDHVQLVQNDVYSNLSPGWGGGVYIYNSSDVRLVGNTIHDNAAATGAGMLLAYVQDLVLTDSDISHNSASRGGGLHAQSSDRIALERTRIYSNTAASNRGGGGIYLNECDGVTFINTLLADNHVTGPDDWGGSGIHIARSSTRFIHTSIARNTGGTGEGLYLRERSTAWLTNTILVSHTVGAFLDWSTLTGTHTLWGAGAWANVTDVVEFDDGVARTGADIHGDPVFADPDAGDYHILPPSAAWNAALDVGLGDDIDGDARPQWGGVDVGADEYADACLVRLNDGTLFGTVQAAVDASTQATDVVKVHGRCDTVHDQGGLHQVVYLDKSLTLQGGWNGDFTVHDPATYPATLDARRQGRVIYVTGGGTPIIEDLVITGGNSSDETSYPGFGVGGGICVADADPIIRGNVITNNVSYTGTEPGTGGGGIFIRGASATAIISGNAILSNTARAQGTGSGGGIYLFRSDPQIIGNEIRHNTACYGGGVTAYDADGMQLQRNRIISNTAIEDVLATGGGLTIEFTGPFTMTNNIIAQNDVSVGGNQAFARGGGVYLYGSPSSPDPNDYAFGWLANNTIAQNTGGTGDGLYLLASTMTMANNIVVSHTEGLRAASYSSAADLRYTLFYGNGQDTGGQGTITNTHPIVGQRPLFVNPAASDYHVWPHSPAVDAGDPAGVPPAPALDLDGEPRHLGDGVDVGADEVGCAVQLNDGPAYPTIEGAIRAATHPSDVVRVSGICLAHDVELTRTLTLEGGWSRDFSRHDPQARATLDAQGQGRVLEIRGGAPTVAYLNLINGQTDADGAGIYVGGGAQATLEGNAIHHNQTGSQGAGGGVYYIGQSLWLRDNQIYSNTAGIGGGGGVYLYSTGATLAGNEITANRTTNSGDGGGVEVGSFSAATLERNTIRANTAHRNGGGLFTSDQSDITLTNNVIADNVCCQSQFSVGGAGAWLGSGDHVLRHNTLASNQGGDGAGIRLGGDAVLTNTIIVSHSVGITLVTSGSSAILEGTLWHANGQDHGGPGTLVTGTIDLHLPPKFVDAGSGDYHLQAGSPAVNAGVALPEAYLDRDGAPRPDCVAWDIGAYEVQGLPCWGIYVPLTLRGGS